MKLNWNKKRKFHFVFVKIPTTSIIFGFQAVTLNRYTVPIPVDYFFFSQNDHLFIRSLSLQNTPSLCMVPVRKRRHAKLPDFDEAHKSTWYNLEVNKRSHFLFNYSNHWSLHRLPDLPLESKWQILLLLPHETFQVILARGHQWWSWWASETHGNRCILQKGRNYVWYRFPSRVLWSPFSWQGTCPTLSFLAGLSLGVWRYLRGPAHFELPKSPWLWGRVFITVSVTWSFHLGACSFVIFCFLWRHVG